MIRDGFPRVKFLSLLIEELIRVNKDFRQMTLIHHCANQVVREARPVVMKFLTRFWTDFTSSVWNFCR